MREFEAHFLDINVAEIESKLLAIGAKKVGEFDLQEIILDTKDRTWNKIHKLIRLRTDGKKSTIAYKEEIKANTMGGREEIEFGIQNMQNMKLILEKIGMIAVREQEKKRVTYKLKDVYFDIDFWPKVPPYIEIESDNEEKVREAAKLLGFDWKDACLMDAKRILIEIYGLKNFDQVKYFTFDKFEYHEQQ
ncbi:MAG TPA: class IV adenylate cyclase [Verrucomicrobiae bacterium]|nr:class IV adenylate cyclase [Verrucomicrobiae bacterium]